MCRQMDSLKKSKEKVCVSVRVCVCTCVWPWCVQVAWLNAEVIAAEMLALVQVGVVFGGGGALSGGSVVEHRIE